MFIKILNTPLHFIVRRFLIGDEELLKNVIVFGIRIKMKKNNMKKEKYEKEFENKRIYNKKFLKTKMKSHTDDATDFHEK